MESIEMQVRRLFLNDYLLKILTRYFREKLFFLYEKCAIFWTD